MRRAKAKRLYAQGTTVSVASSRAEIEKLVTRYGASSFASGWHEGVGAQIAFVAHERRVRFELPIDSATSVAETQRRWRCLALAIKAKLEVVESGIASFESEFLAHIVVNDEGQTVADWARPALAEAYKRGSMMGGLQLGQGARR